MFCNKCGKEVNDDAVVCIHCGCSLKEPQPIVSNENNESKVGMGVLFGLLLGLLGFLGMLMYPSGTVARKTFIKGWLITAIVATVLSVVIGIIVFIVMGSAAAGAVSGLNNFQNFA